MLLVQYILQIQAISPVGGLDGTFMTNENPKVGWRNVYNTISYFNDNGSDLTSHKIRVQQYDDGDFNSEISNN